MIKRVTHPLAKLRVGQAMPDEATQPQAGVIHRSFAEVNGVRLQLSSVGCVKPILFLHGFPEFWRAWKSQLTELGSDSLEILKPKTRCK
jgi:pimeloyl-ACP methyl ester carboxylesterase